MKSRNGKYRAFLIDADNTIFDYNRAEKESLYEALQEIDFKGSFELAYLKYREINKQLFKLFELGKMNLYTIKLLRFKTLFKTFRIKANISMVAEKYVKNLSTKAYLLPHSMEVIEFLSRRALLCLATNGIASVQRGRIARAELEVFFHDIFISEEIGAAKPDSAFYRAATEKLPVPLYEILCIGDTPSSDIRGGYIFGIDTCWIPGQPAYYPVEEPHPDYIISDLRELKKFVFAVC
ncbi:MAG: YjjG family noncanonical pyrimidine nucleotidase [Spirochaetales bacterium]|nr:YjjG family noncanonical pyrimidine nucleotidase [Spirochaetales bacterium]